MAGNNIYVQGSYIDIHDNKVVNLSVDKGEVHVDQTNDSMLGTSNDNTAETDGMPYFNTPASFIAYLKAADVERLPSEDSINKKQNTFTGSFPDWTFTDCDAMEAKRRINVGKRFLNIFKSA